MATKPKTPERLEDIKITPEAKALFERAVDKALTQGRAASAKKTAPARSPKSRKAKGVKAS